MFKSILSHAYVWVCSIFVFTNSATSLADYYTVNIDTDNATEGEEWNRIVSDQPIILNYEKEIEDSWNLTFKWKIKLPNYCQSRKYELYFYQEGSYLFPALKVIRGTSGRRNSWLMGREAVVIGKPYRFIDEIICFDDDGRVYFFPFFELTVLGPFQDQ